MSKQIENKIENIIKDFEEAKFPDNYLPTQLIDIRQALQQTREEAIKEAIELSDKIEAENKTEFNEWRAFKHFRNKLRDKLNNLK